MQQMSDAAVERLRTGVDEHVKPVVRLDKKILEISAQVLEYAPTSKNGFGQIDAAVDMLVIITYQQYRK